VAESVSEEESEIATTAILHESVREAIPGAWPYLLGLQCTRTLRSAAAAAREGAIEFLIEATDADPGVVRNT